MSEELKPCPFCSGPARECHNGDVPFGMYWVLCDTCHACPGDKTTREEAIAAWNRRSPLVGSSSGSNPSDLPTALAETTIVGDSHG